MDDSALLAAFVRDKSDEAFRELVRRHIGMVYSVCQRQLGDAHWAEDVTQAVFILLVRKAGDLKRGVVLGGWLYKTAVYACSNAKEMRRTRNYHEKLVMPMTTMNGQDTVERAEMEGLLDEGMMALNQVQREVLVLRFFENRPLTEVAKLRGKSLYATQKSLDEGMTKLRRFLATKGVTVAAGIVAAVMLEQSARAVPVGLANVVGSVALGQGSAVSLHVRQLVSQLMKRAARAKLIGALAAATVVFALALGGWGVAVSLIQPVTQTGNGVAMIQVMSPQEQAQEEQALWGTLRKAEKALRTMDSAALAHVVAFSDRRQAEDWEVMARVFKANLLLKQAAVGRFGAEGATVSAIKTFGERLDEVLPRLDGKDVEWNVGTSEASVHFAYQDDAASGGTIFFVRDGEKRADGESDWRIDAGRSVEVVLEGLNSQGWRVPVREMSAAEEGAVLSKMNDMEDLFTTAARRIADGTVSSVEQTREELAAADATGKGRAFFHLALRYDNNEEDRTRGSGVAVSHGVRNEIAMWVRP